ncbi:MAG: hypothetical protein OHK005_09600 [Candidatus Methylacidiphilales bacterium]
MIPNPAELVDGRQTPDDDMIAEDHMSAQGSVVGQDAMVAHDTVVGNVRVGEEMVVVTDNGGFTWTGAAVYRDELPKFVVVPDLEVGGFSFVFQVLGLPADRTERVKEIAGPETAWSLKNNVTDEPTAWAEFDVRTDDAPGADFNIIGQAGLWGNNGSGVNRHY